MLIFNLILLYSLFIEKHLSYIPVLLRGHNSLFSKPEDDLYKPLHWAAFFQMSKEDVMQWHNGHKYTSA